eukprot:CAMPEP_0168463802 /NCGR_PEP_ID=MMETSP0228-20121227/55250_1 /TAXON_ID=133427 /ORGANISM="Protoceratium reticulatum, Strain CCCM 535 (=CCMP 1889)" /LENGTH=35 /DNA_ID= /DNA_START= /DNA_END= /DNA_ORIENTATION=
MRVSMALLMFAATIESGEELGPKKKSTLPDEAMRE